MTPTVMLTATAAIPTMREMRAPWMMRLRMSRPTWSVPSTWAALPASAQTGGVKRRIRLCRAGS